VKETRISLPELGLIAGTRGALGFGLGLLLADRWAKDQRRAVGWTLVLIGLASTIPLALDVLGRTERVGGPHAAGTRERDEGLTEVEFSSTSEPWPLEHRM
jgi:4-amino-4-deoxy-L-arabinose transferase-like glycosyltransferase